METFTEPFSFTNWETPKIKLIPQTNIEAQINLYKHMGMSQI